jgi:hypothetical protein
MNDDFGSLIEDYFDDTLSSERIGELAEALRNDASLRTHFRDGVWEQVLLREIATVEVIGMEKSTDRKAGSFKQSNRYTWRLSTRLLPLAACLMAIAGAWFFLDPNHLKQAIVATLVEKEADVIVEREEQPIAPKIESALRAGDRVLAGPRGQAVISFDDSTQLEVRGDSNITVQPNGQRIERENSSTSNEERFLQALQSSE